MPEPIAIYGAANTSYSLAKELYGYAEKWATAGSRAKKIQTRFGWTNAQAKIFVDFFKDHESSLETGLAQSISLATERLSVSLKEVKNKVQTYDPDKLLRLLQWPWVVDALEAAEQSLADWSLLGELKETLRKYILNSTAWEKAYLVAALLDHVEMIKKQNEVRRKDKAELLSTMRSEPQNRPENEVYYWKDIIVVPEDIRRNDKLFNDFKVEIAKLAEVLKVAKSDLTHVPPAACWFECAPNKFGIAYRIPSTIEKMRQDEEGHELPDLTYTLKDLVKRKAEHTLDERLALATQVAREVAFVHGLEWVHKSLRSSNVLLAYDRNEPKPFAGLGRVNLKGFNIARRGTSDVRSTGIERLDAINWRSQEADVFYDAFESLDGRQSNGIYTTFQSNTAASHPSDLLALPKQEFFKYKHDIYGLGVILLELGLWRDITSDDSKLKEMAPEKRMQHLIELAEKELGLVVGQKYLGIVKACLNVDESDWNSHRILNELSEIRM